RLRRRGGYVARACEVPRLLVGRRRELSQRLEDDVEGDPRRLRDLRLRRPARRRLLQLAVRPSRSCAATDDRERGRRATDRGRELRLLGRQRTLAAVL